MGPVIHNSSIFDEPFNYMNIRKSNTLYVDHLESKMTLPKLTTERFISEHGFRITVQVPDENAKIVTAEILNQSDLEYGDYDSVTFKTAIGVQQFRSLGGGRNAATETILEVPCIELSFFLANDEALVARVIEAIYSVHPCEEPVMYGKACLRILHIRGLDEDNPNRFWNAAPANWLPNQHG